MGYYFSAENIDPSQLLKERSRGGRAFSKCTKENLIFFAGEGEDYIQSRRERERAERTISEAVLSEFTTKLLSSSFFGCSPPPPPLAYMHFSPSCE